MRVSFPLRARCVLMPDQSLTSDPAAGSLQRRADPRPSPAPALTRGQVLARAALVEAVLVRRPLILLEGAPGIGKTLVLDQACAELARCDIAVARVSGRALRPAAVLQQLGASQPAPGAAEPGDWLLDVSEQVLAIDDAQALATETLALLAALLRLRPDGGRVLQVLLVGGTGLLRHVAEAAPELRERAAIPLAIAPMTPEESASFLAGRLQARQGGAAGVAPLPARAARALLLRAEGIPARIDAELAGLPGTGVPRPAMVPAPARPLPASLRPPVARSGTASWRQRSGAVGGAAALGFGIGVLVMGGIVWVAWPARQATPVSAALTPWAAPLPERPHPTPSAARPGSARPATPQPVPPATILAAPSSVTPPDPGDARSLAGNAPPVAPWWTALPPPAAQPDTALEDELARVAMATSMDRQHDAAAPGLLPPPAATPPAMGRPAATPPDIQTPSPQVQPQPLVAATPGPALPSPVPMPPRTIPRYAREAPQETRAALPPPPLRVQPRTAVTAHQVLPGGEMVGDLLRRFLGGAGPVSRAAFAALNPGVPVEGRLAPGTVVMLPVRPQAPAWPRRYEEAGLPRRFEEPAPRATSSRPYFCNQIRPLNAAEFAYAREVCGR